jgi:hypothetical protein
VEDHTDGTITGQDTTTLAGVPSHNKFRHVFCLLAPLAFQAYFSERITALMNQHGLTPIPLDRPELRPIAVNGMEGPNVLRLGTLSANRPCTWSALGRRRITANGRTGHSDRILGHNDPEQSRIDVSRHTDEIGMMADTSSFPIGLGCLPS